MPHSADDDRRLKLALETATRAGTELVRLRRSGGWTASYKDAQELVTTADLAADALIRAALTAGDPAARLLSEEGEHSVDWAEPTWVVDPLDGTVNYAYGLDYVSVCLAFAERGRVRVGVVHNPFTKETFSAIAGRGAWLDGQPIRPGAAASLRAALIATGFPYERERLEPILARFCRVMRVCRDTRRLASAALDICGVASGRLDACYETLRPWDVAAAGLIACEAGARRGHFGPVPPELPPDVCGIDVLFAQPGLFDALLAVLVDES